MKKHKHISELPSGYVFRRTVNRQPQQRFFSVSNYGSRHEALKAAISYRDQQLIETPSEPVPRRRNIRNTTGVTGVAWHLRPNRHRKNTITNSIRATYIDELTGEMSTTAFAISKYGLWNAYKKAVKWRSALEGNPMKPSEVKRCFCTFMEIYMDRIKDPTQGVIDDDKDYTEEVAEMKAALRHTHEKDTKMPADIRAVIEECAFNADPNYKRRVMRQREKEDAELRSVG